jgi:hypothetical protein
MTEDFDQIQIESHMLRRWEEEQSFNDILYEWMSKAPWLLISAAAHLLVFFILAAVPWSYFNKDNSKTIEASIEQAPEEIFEEPEEEVIEEEIEEPVEEPVLQDSEIVETETLDFEESEGDPDFLSDSPFDENQFSNVVGLGGGAGGKYGQRGLGGGKRARGGKAIEQALEAGLEWLKNHQAPNGSWDCDGFNAECGKLGSNVCTGLGYPEHDVGVTGLALLAFLGMGNTTNQGPYQEVVKNGIAWLKSQQDPDSGMIGDRTSREFIYNHAIATLAICENYYFSKSPLHKRVAQQAINFIVENRNPYSAWRYDVPPAGESDTSVTGWMVFALAAAKDAGLKVDEGAFDGALAWFDEVTDTSNGRVGYAQFGSASSRVTGVNDHFPKEKGEAMTAVGLLCRVFLKQDPAKEPVMEKHADLLLRTLPEWDPDGYGCDVYYWYYGTYAMFQMGAFKSEYWQKWEKALDGAVIKSQRKDNDEKGSWDAAGPWGHSGGRVYSTALSVLCLEVYFRYSKVLGSR